MSLRHRWGPSIEEGYVKCLNCGLEVRKSDRSRGGLGPCETGRWKITKFKESSETALIECPNCKKQVFNSIFCIYCAHQLHPLNYKKEDS